MELKDTESIEYVTVSIKETDAINKQRIKTLPRRVQGPYLEVVILTTEEGVVLGYRTERRTTALISELERILPESAEVGTAELDVKDRLEEMDVGVEFRGCADRRLDAYTPLQPAVANESPLEPVPLALSDVVATAGEIEGEVLVQLLIESRDDEGSRNNLEKYLETNAASARQFWKKVLGILNDGDKLAGGNEHRLRLLRTVNESYTVNARAAVGGSWPADKARGLIGSLSGGDGPYYRIEGELIEDDLDRLREDILTRTRYTTASKTRFTGSRRRRAIVAEVDAVPHFLLPETEHIPGRTVKQLDTPGESPPTPPTLRDLHGMR